jgi:hypothetical protein
VALAVHVLDGAVTSTVKAPVPHDEKKHVELMDNVNGAHDEAVPDIAPTEIVPETPQLHVVPDTQVTENAVMPQAEPVHPHLVPSQVKVSVPTDASEPENFAFNVVGTAGAQHETVAPEATPVP